MNWVFLQKVNRINAKRKKTGVHAKSKSANLQSSKNYKKKYRGQGR